MISRARVLTAADHKYFRTVWQLLRSYERYRSTTQIDWVLYDLGLHQDDISELKSRFPWCAIKEFQYSNYPEHVRLKHGNYAWKPIIIAEELSQSDVPLIWFDAGTILRQRWSEVIALVQKQGLWILRSQCPLRLKCDTHVLCELSVPVETWHMPEYAAGALGFDTHNNIVRRIIERWKVQALNEKRIQPPSSNVDHKHDQALLNCILYKAAAEREIELPTEEIDISSMAPTRLISTRNFVSNGTPFKLDFLVRAWYRVSKIADQLFLRWYPRADKFVGGLRRFFKEYFQVTLYDLESRIKLKVGAPAFSYLADPFLVQEQGHNFLFAEEFQYLRDAGRLVVLQLDGVQGVESARPLSFAGSISQIDCHASFPFVFKVDGRMHMVPETCGRMSVDLYQCRVWPQQWQIRRRLLVGIDAADSMLIFHKDKWWLFTSVREHGPQRHLEIFSCDDLLTGAFLPHPINKQKLYANHRFGTGRNAGRLFANEKGTIFRLMQKSDRYYGQGSQLMEIVTLTEDEFLEVPAQEDLSGPVSLEPEKWHHGSSAGHWLAFDKRTRVH